VTADISPPTPMRIAFVGQSTYFQACSLEEDAGREVGIEPQFFEFRQGADGGGLLAGLEAFEPDVVIAFRPEILPAGLLHDLPGAVIGFAGARVIEQTIRERLPEGFQRAEYLEAHGMIDMVVQRQDLRAALARLCALLTRSPRAELAA